MEKIELFITKFRLILVMASFRMYKFFLKKRWICILLFLIAIILSFKFLLISIVLVIISFVVFIIPIISDKTIIMTEKVVDKKAEYLQKRLEIIKKLIAAETLEDKIEAIENLEKNECNNPDKKYSKIIYIVIVCFSILLIFFVVSIAFDFFLKLLS